MPVGGGDARREDTVLGVVEARLAVLGYEVGPNISYGSSDKTWWFVRKGRVFATESILLDGKWRPRPILSAMLFASRRRPDEIARKGLEGNAGGQSPYLHVKAPTLKPPIRHGSVLELGLFDGWQIRISRLCDDPEDANRVAWLHLEAVYHD